MKLEEYIKGKIESGEATGKKDAYRRLAATIKEQAKETVNGETVSVNTIENAAGGLRIKKYSKAEAISKGTLGEVSIKELCE